METIKNLTDFIVIDKKSGYLVILIALVIYFIIFFRSNIRFFIYTLDVSLPLWVEQSKDLDNPKPKQTQS